MFNLVVDSNSCKAPYIFFVSRQWDSWTKYNPSSLGSDVFLLFQVFIFKFFFPLTATQEYIYSFLHLFTVTWSCVFLLRTLQGEETLPPCGCVATGLSHASLVSLLLQSCPGCRRKRSSTCHSMSTSSFWASASSSSCSASSFAATSSGLPDTHAHTHTRLGTTLICCSCFVWNAKKKRRLAKEGFGQIVKYPQNGLDWTILK